MKIPKARQLPSGAWFCRVRVDGQDIAITRPTEKEAIAEAMAIKSGIKEAAKHPQRKTVKQAINDYIDARRNILSPATIRGYTRIRDNRFASMMNKDISSITQEQWQRAVNAEARNYSAKTLTNSWRFLASVIRESTGKQISVRLPQIVHNPRPWLTPEQILVFVEAIKGTSIEIPALLALSSLRSSELLDLKWEDIDLNAGIIRVNGAAVFDENDKLIHKQANKNAASRRIVPIIPPLEAALMDAPRKGEYVVSLSYKWLYASINRRCRENSLPEVGLHGLRHSFASLAYHLQIPEKIAMRIGGWSNDQTMKRIYTHLSQSDVSRHASAFSNFFHQPIDAETDNGNENGNALLNP